MVEGLGDLMCECACVRVCECACVCVCVSFRMLHLLLVVEHTWLPLCHAFSLPLHVQRTSLPLVGAFLSLPSQSIFLPHVMLQLALAEVPLGSLSPQEWVAVVDDVVLANLTTLLTMCSMTSQVGSSNPSPSCLHACPSVVCACVGVCM
jgi:hypothetical protein